MKIPRNVSGMNLVKTLRILGCRRTRQGGWHIGLTSELNGTHHLTVPNHSSIKLGTLATLLKSVATHHCMTVDELLTRLEF